MISSELLQELRQLNRADKLRIVQFLANELLQQDPNSQSPITGYPVWSPYDAVDAADAMLAVLRTAEAEDHAQG